MIGSLIPFSTHFFVTRSLVSKHSISTSWQDKDDVYQRIFSLPRLKYCKLQAPCGNDYSLLPHAINEQHQCQTFEYFIIDGSCRLDQLVAILTYMPRLKHLSCKIEYSENNNH